MTTATPNRASSECVVCGEPSAKGVCTDCAPGYYGTAAVCNLCGDPTRNRKSPGVGRVCNDCRTNGRSPGKRYGGQPITRTLSDAKRMRTAATR